MPIGSDTQVQKGRLPHLTKPDKTYFVTFCSKSRRHLTPAERDLALRACVDGHRQLYWMHCAVIMPDHVHLLITPFNDFPLPNAIGRIKGASAYQINKLRLSSSHVWQREYFDRIVRSDESLSAKADYIWNNPVRKRLVAAANEWPWFWRAPAG